MKSILIFSLLLIAVMSINAQTVTYTYDNAGNRIARTVTVNKSPAAPQTSQAPGAITNLSDVITENNISIYPNYLLHITIDGKSSVWKIIKK